MSQLQHKKNTAGRHGLLAVSEYLDLVPDGVDARKADASLCIAQKIFDCLVSSGHLVMSSLGPHSLPQTEILLGIGGAMSALGEIAKNL